MALHRQAHGPVSLQWAMWGSPAAVSLSAGPLLQSERVHYQPSPDKQVNTFRNTGSFVSGPSAPPWLPIFLHRPVHSGTSLGSYEACLAMTHVFYLLHVLSYLRYYPWHAPPPLPLRPITRH